MLELREEVASRQTFSRFRYWALHSVRRLDQGNTSSSEKTKSHRKTRRSLRRKRRFDRNSVPLPAPRLSSIRNKSSPSTWQVHSLRASSAPLPSSLLP